MWVIVQYAVSLLFALCLCYICYIIIMYYKHFFYVFIVPFLFVFLFCLFCFLFSMFCVCLFMYIVCNMKFLGNAARDTSLKYN